MELPPFKEQMPLPLHLAMHGFATLSLFPRGQSIRRKEWEIELEKKLTYHITDPEVYYYRSAYMDCIRGLDFLAGRPELNKKRIGTWGSRPAQQAGCSARARCGATPRAPSSTLP